MAHKQHFVRRGSCLGRGGRGKGGGLLRELLLGRGEERRLLGLLGCYGGAGRGGGGGGHDQGHGSSVLLLLVVLRGKGPCCCL